MFAPRDGDSGVYLKAGSQRQPAWHRVLGMSCSASPSVCTARLSGWAARSDWQLRDVVKGWLFQQAAASFILGN